MNTTQTNHGDRDPKLWRMARKRASFKKHLYSYMWINLLLWVIWLFTNRFEIKFLFENGYHIPWPLYVTFFWGIAIFFDFISAYRLNHEDLAEKEYKKLKDKNNFL